MNNPEPFDGVTTTEARASIQEHVNRAAGIANYTGPKSDRSSRVKPRPWKELEPLFIRGELFEVKEL